ncbi:hypothetical protein NUM3379_22400 [Kineococcus sp. NUM-3379]
MPLTPPGGPGRAGLLKDGPAASDTPRVEESDSGVVAVVVNRTSTYILGIVSAVRQELQRRGVPMHVQIKDFFTADVSTSLRHAVEQGAVLGIITLPADKPQPEVVRLLDEHPELPVVDISGTTPGHAAVRADNRPGMTQLVRHVLAQPGVRRVALVRGVPHHPDSSEREAVVREVLAEHGLALDEALVVEGMFDRETAYRSVADLLRAGERFDALVALNDASALGAMDAVLDHGLRVPEDVVVSGFDDDHLMQQPRCPLTTVSQELTRQGQLAVELLLDLVATGTPRHASGTPARLVQVPTRLVPRASTARAARADGQADGRGAPAARAAEDVATLHTVLTLNRTLMGCTTEREAMQALDACLSRLGVTRCFVVLREPAQPGTAEPAGRVHLAHPRTAGDPAALGPFPVAELLPPALRGELRRGCLVVQPLSVRGREIGYVLYDEPELREHTAEVLRMDLSTRLDTIARRHELEAAVARRTEELRLANAELRRSLHLDGLTGIANRVAFDEHLQRAWELPAAAGGPLSVLFVDVDHFKAYNDTYGHLRGDEALRAVAGALAGACGDEAALAARFGGEEFAVVLPGTSTGDALAVAERVHREVRRLRVEHRGSPVRPWLTVSIGIATARSRSGLRPADLLTAADAAVYAAKAAGRDRTATAPEPCPVVPGPAVPGPVVPGPAVPGPVVPGPAGDGVPAR